MWWTSCGKRTLEGAEAKVFAETLWDMLDESNLSEFDDYDLGIHAFDGLTYGQKVSVLSIVGNGLLRRDVPRAELTAVLEGGLAAVFEHLKHLIIIAIDIPELPDFLAARVYSRKLTASAWIKCRSPSSNCE